MKYDLNLTFGEIFDNDRSALLKQLIDIQHHKAKREASEEWAEQLRFIDISDVPPLSNTEANFGRPRQLVLPLTEPQEDNGSRYVAVSWRWTGGDDLPPCGCETRPTFDYRIQRPDREPHKSKFPSQHLERAILFAQDRKIGKLWVDIECIYQEPGDGDEDKALGIQIMDAIYGGSDFSVGLLTTGLIYQTEVSTFADLLSGRVFTDFRDTEAPMFKAEIEYLELQTLVLRILSDSRWSRGWIFQEDHLASDKMILLVPHSEDVTTRNLPYDFGTIPGNLQVKVSVFRKAVTMFCLANEESEFRWPNTEILAKAKQYNIWNREEHRTTPLYRNKQQVRLWTDANHYNPLGRKAKVNRHNESVYPSTTSSILEDICNRELLKTEDRVAVMANATKFATRLDIRPDSALVKSKDYSLSAILLALVLLNGEILNHDTEYSIEGIMEHTVRSYLRRKQYKFNAPMLRYQQSWIDHCRFKGSTLRINNRGVEVQGHLFALLPKRWPYPERSKPNPLKLSKSDIDDLHQLDQDPEARRVLRGRIFSEFSIEVIGLVISKLRMAYGTGCLLAEFLERQLELHATPPPVYEAKPSTSYILAMMAGLVQAILDEREVRLARLEGELPTAPPSAIFIAPLHNENWMSEYFTKQYGGGVARGWVFTSWDNGVRSTRISGMEQLASLEVFPTRHEPFGYMNRWDSDQADNAVLRSCGWVNGVWVTEGKPMRKYTFPISGLTEPPPCPTRDLLGKRKRDGGNDGESSD